MTDWLMVIITAVYVVATIFRCRANNISAKASKEQLEESKRQFEESQKQAKAELDESKRQFKESQEQAKAELEESKRQFDITKQQAEEQFNEQKVQYEETKRLSLMPLLQLYEAEATDSANNKGFLLSIGHGEPYRYSSKCISLRNIGLGSAKNIVFDCYNDKKEWKTEQHPLKTLALISGNHVNINLSYISDKYHMIFYYQDLLGNHYKQTIDLDANSSIKIINHEIERDDS